jgi:hypothetical protein
MKIRTRLLRLGILSITIITSIVLTGCQSSVSRARVGYRNFPPELRPMLDQRIAELKTNGGICIAGRVRFSDRKPIRGGQDVKVNLFHVIDESLQVYNGGWLIMDRVVSSNYAGAGKGFILRAFGYDPIDASVDILDGEMTYLSFVMQKTPPERLASVKGTIFDENDIPFKGARVSLSFPFALGADREPGLSVITDSTGQYFFEGLSSVKHDLTAIADGCAHHSGTFVPQPGQTTIENRKLYPKLELTIDYVYQPNGSRDFTGDNLQKGTLYWIIGNEGANFSTGRIEMHTPDDLRDLELHQIQNKLYFRIYYFNGRNGFYDAGPVEFDSFTQAGGGNIYPTRIKECIIGHVYVVRTYEDHYAKLIVRNIDQAKNP